MKIFAALMLLASTALAQTSGAPAPDPAKLKLDPHCILQAVAKRKNISLLPTVPLPQIYFGSQIPVKQFDDAIEKQWGQRPGVVLNAYVAHLNEIYLLDEAAYYLKVGRFIDDSLAHEYVHYLQVTYQNASLEDESLEGDAVDIQTWFRETYLIPANAPSPCLGL